MPDGPSNSDPLLDTLIRADLDRRADAIDPRALFDRITAGRRAADTAAAIAEKPAGGTTGGTALLPRRSLRLPVGRRVARWVSGISAAAAAIVIAVLLGTQGATPAQA